VKSGTTSGFGADLQAEAERENEMRRRSEFSLRHRRNDEPEGQNRRAVRRGLRHDNKSGTDQTQEQGFPKVNSSIRPECALRPIGRRRTESARPAYRRSAIRPSSS